MFFKMVHSNLKNAKFKVYLDLKCVTYAQPIHPFLSDQAISHPLVPGGFRDLLWTTFSAEFCDKYYTVYIYTLNRAWIN